MKAPRGRARILNLTIRIIFTVWAKLVLMAHDVATDSMATAGVETTSA